MTRKSAAKWQNKVSRLFPPPCPGIFCKAGISNFNQFCLEASRVISLHAWSFYHGLLWDVFNKSKQWHVKIQPIAQSTIFGEFVTLCNVTSPWWLVRMMMRMMSRCMLTRDRVAHAAAALLGELTSRSLLPAAIITIVKLQAINIIMVSNHCCKCLHRLHGISTRVCLPPRDMSSPGQRTGWRRRW